MSAGVMALGDISIRTKAAAFPRSKEGLGLGPLDPGRRVDVRYDAHAQAGTAMRTGTG
jgi:hypothetical protein